MCYRGDRGIVPTEGMRRRLLRPEQLIVKMPRIDTRLGNSDMSVEMSMPYRRGQLRKSMTCQESFAGHDIVCCQVAQYGGTHSAVLRSALLPFPASSLPRELVSGRHLPLPERALKKSSE